MTTSIYGRAAAIYRNHGWQGVLPLPPEQKAHPPTGYTGANGVDPDQAQIDLWCRTQDEGNIALRLPDGVIGVDVDAYLDKHGDVSLLALQTELGLLPPTWRSTSRGLGHSGIYLFRVPPGRYQDQPAPAIEIIQHHHRYMVVMPSIHPEGRPYLWYDPDGVEQHRPPNIDELPWLPDPWVDYLAVKQRAEQAYEPRAHQVDEWTPAVTRAFTKALMDMPGGRHNAAMRGALALLRLLALEHPGADAALTELGVRFRTAIGDRSSPGQAEKEWSDLVAGAIGIVRETPSEAPVWEQRPPRPDPGPDWVWWDIGKDVPPDDPNLSPDLLDVINTVDPEYDWLVEGLLERGDRVIFTGPEGQGKSTLLRQMGVQLGSAIHPFTLEHTEPVNVLLVDCENSRRQIRRKLGVLHEQSVDQYQIGRMRFEFRTEGLHLCRTDDRDWLNERVQVDQTQLLIIGPLYKLQSGDPKDEQVARQVALYLDRLRAATGIAMIIEAHSPYADGGNARVMRPYGASLWSRWPEFGIHLAADGTITHWRGQREERAWPAKLERATAWPWVVGQAVREEWDGPKQCMAAVLAYLEQIAPEERSRRKLIIEMRALELSYRDVTFDDALQRLVNRGDVTRRKGPRSATLYSFTDHAARSEYPFPDEEF